LDYIIHCAYAYKPYLNDNLIDKKKAYNSKFSINIIPKVELSKKK
jgi:hypothetical protein